MHSHSEAGKCQCTYKDAHGAHTLGPSLGNSMCSGLTWLHDTNHLTGSSVGTIAVIANAVADSVTVEHTLHANFPHERCSRTADPTERHGATYGHTW
jgi:hypothetical protein